MIEDMAQVHMSEAELARDLHAVLEKVRQGAEVIVERDAKPVAVIKAPQFRGRPIDECIAMARARVLRWPQRPHVPLGPDVRWPLGSGVSTVPPWVQREPEHGS